MTQSWIAGAALGAITILSSCSAFDTPADPAPVAPAGDAAAPPSTAPPPSASNPSSLPDFGLGARFDDTKRIVQFRVRSARATRIELDLFAVPRGEAERVAVVLSRAAQTDVWSADVPLADLTAAGITTVYYGFRVWGPNWPYVPTWTKGSLDGFVADVGGEGDRFNPNKLLYDPYALELSHDPFSPEPFDGSAYEIGPESRRKDSSLVAPKGVVLRANDVDIGAKPERALADDTIYEVHVRGLTMRDSSVPSTLRGTYRGAGLKAKYLRSLGVTAIELLPIHETQNDQNDEAPARANYWGYASNSFFAPDRRFASDRSAGGPTREVREMVRAFHDEGIKVFLDVVFNHTGEGGSNHLFSWRGFGASTYYEPGDGPYFADNNGVGPNWNPRSPAARQLVLDSLAYYARYLGFDGFRFDLASVLGDGCASYCFVFDKGDASNVLNRAAKELPARGAEGGPGVDLIAEPWAIGLGTYQVGGFPRGWSEWNDHFRDTIRKAQNRVGVADVTPGELAERLLGSRPLYEDDGRTPSASINFLTAHDGFTLRDLYTFDQKQNEQPMPYGPSPGGADENLSWSQGGVVAEQEKAARTGLLLLAVSTGVPMMLGGDELLRTQRGNNNAYNLDSEATWLDWTALDTKKPFVSFARGVLGMRQGHAALRPKRWRDGTDHDGNGLADVAMLDAAGAPATPALLQSATARFVAIRFDGEEVGDDARSVYVAYNWGAAARDVTLPSPGQGKSWHLAAHSEIGFVSQKGAEPVIAASATQLPPRAAIVLVER